MTANIHGKVILITGATNGIGRAAALALAKLGALVVIVGRSPERTNATAAAIKAAGGAVDTLVADLSLMADTRRLADTFRARYNRLDVLVNNAGAVFSRREVTAEGYETTFALNHLSPFLLTNALLDLLRVSAPARIVTVSSGAHRAARINFDDLQGAQSYGKAGFTAYGQSKLANILFTYELARRLDGSGVAATVMHPGLVATGFGHNQPGMIRTVMRTLHRFALTPEQGAETLIYLASSPEAEGVSGQYFEKCQPVRSSRASYDAETARRLWEVSEQMTGLHTAPDPASSGH